MTESIALPSAVGLGRVLLALLLPAASLRGGGDALTEGWDQGARLFFNEAARTFASARGTGVDAESERVLGRAVMLLGVQPRTGANLEAARALLQGLIGSEATGEAAIAARYYLARLDQLHTDQPDLERARGHYRDLVERHPDHFFGQLARLKLAMLALYAPARPASLATRLPEAEKWGEGITDPVLRCQYHLMLAGALAREDGREAERLEHLLAMEATGRVIRDPTRSLMLVEIGETARVVGRRAEAVRAYRQFIAEFPRDVRVGAIRARLAEVEGVP